MSIASGPLSALRPSPAPLHHRPAAFRGVPESWVLNPGGTARLPVCL